MRWLAAIAAIVLLTSSVAVSQPTTLWTDAVPPARFQHPTTVQTVFLPPEQISQLCDRSDRPSGVQIIACTYHTKSGGTVVLMPLPCRAAQSEYYARILCHELAHVQGWPATHGN